MATRITKKVNQFYVLYATEHMIIDEDEQGLYCDVISESDISKTHRVHVDETTVVPVASHCSCGCFEHKGTCKHIELVVNPFYARIYKSNLEKLVAKQEVAEVSPEIAEQTIEAVPPIAMELPEELKGYRKTVKVGKPGSTDLAYKGNLNGQQGFSLLKVS